MHTVMKPIVIDNLSSIMIIMDIFAIKNCVTDDFIWKIFICKTPKDEKSIKSAKKIKQSKK